MVRSTLLLCVFSSMVGCGGTAPPPVGPAKAPAPAPSAPSAVAAASVSPPTASAAAPPPNPAAVHSDAIVVDTHYDITQLMVIDGADLGKPQPNAQTDIPRMRQGGLDAEFLSVWVAPMIYPGEKAYARSLEEFAAIDAMIAKNRDVA